MEHWERDKSLWRFLCALLAPWLRRKFNYSYEHFEVEGPCLVLINHATDWDPLLTAIAFGGRRHLYFVASEHIFRWGFLWRVINWILHPIARLKGTTASDTVMTVMRRIRKGAGVAIFAEGNRSWDGRTGYILPSTGKLARMCGGSLVTFRLEGGYFTSPRWGGGSLRRGRMHGTLMGVYSHEEMKAMTAEEVNEIINRDLYEDAYARQREAPVAYRGKGLAEGLETMLCVCPRCRSLGELRSAGNSLRCGVCSFTATMDEYGFLHGPGLEFDNIRDWDLWQSELLRQRISGSGKGELFFSDDGVALDVLSSVPGRHSQTRLGQGTLSMDRENLSCAGFDFPLEGISGMGLHGPLGMSFTWDGRHYELSGKKPNCIRKYMTVYDIITAKEEKEVAHQ